MMLVHPLFCSSDEVHAIHGTELFFCQDIRVEDLLVLVLDKHGWVFRNFKFFDVNVKSVPNALYGAFIFLLGVTLHFAVR